jgi:hypothetical protein
LVSFFKKKAGEPDVAADGAGDNGKKGGFEPDPGKAARFFEHARAMHDSHNYEYAMTLWLQGLRKDPTNLDALEAFFRSSEGFLNKDTKAKGPTKEQLKNFGGKDKGPLEKYLINLLHWGTKPHSDWPAGLKAMEEASKFELNEPGYWIGERVLNIASSDPKAKKEQFVRLMDLFTMIGGYDKAVQSGEEAMRRDPRDGQLENKVRNLSATATMSRGGYESTEAGSFRANIKDMSKQQELDDEERLVKTEETLDRIIERAAADYKTRPTDPSAIQKLGKLLLERGGPDDEKRAYQLYMQGYKDTESYRFKQLAGDIKMRIARRKVRAIRDKAQAEGGEAKTQYDKANRQLLELERDEYAERVANYPTDLKLKYDLGLCLYQLGEYEKAIEQFQVAQGATGLGSRVLNFLAKSFNALGWLDEAEGTFRRAIDDHESDGDDLALELRYGLLTTLQRKAEENRDLNAAEEAFKLASSIAIQQIGFKDIRDRRSALQTLVQELRKGA